MKLIILMALFSVSIHAADELSERDIANRMMTIARDVEVEGIVQGTSEFQECLQKNKYKKDDLDRDNKAKAASDCFRQKLAGKSPEALAELSDKLNLQTYNLVQSNSSKDVTSYLTNKVYQAMTGVDLEEKDHLKLIKSMKFGTKKMLDQADFIKLYKTRIGKNALLEVSRFCFNDLRKISASATTTVSSFEDYWANEINSNWQLNLADLTDTGKPSFGNISITDQSSIYTSVRETISKNMNPQTFENFFLKCGQQILSLCKEYRKNMTAERGSRACIAEARLQEMRKSLIDTDKVIADFEKMSGKDLALQLDGNVQAKRYQYGSGQGEKTLDELTNFNSADMLKEASTDSELKDIQTQCVNNPGSKSCEDFVTVDDSRNEIIHGIEEQHRLKEEIEVARVKAIGADKASLKKYLEDNGYYDLLAQIESGKDVDIETQIGKVFEARKKAAIALINNRLKSRQMTDDEADDAQAKTANINSNIQEAREEKARLAQVVMFNNIVTSYLSLKDTSGKELGRNVTALRSELDALDNAQVDMDVFENLKEQAKDAGDGAGQNEMNGFQLIDEFLGKKD